MERRRLQSLTVEGLTSIRSASVELGDMNVLIGANGAGKSNLISALAMLGRIIDGELAFYVGQSGGGSGLLHDGPKATPRITLEAQFQDLLYGAELAHTNNDGLVFARERAEISSPSRGGSAMPVTFAPGDPESLVSKIASHEIRVTDESQERLRPLIEALRGCRVFHFQDTSASAPVKQNGYAWDNVTLHPDASNLAAVLMRLRESEPTVYRRIIRDIQGVAPFFRDFVLLEQNENLRLRWKQKNSDSVFPASALSDGTLRFICLATLLNMPESPGLIVLDEPELGLHPYAIVQLAETLRAASLSSQIVIATQSVTLVDEFEPEEIIVVERRDGASTFHKPDLDRLGIWLDEYSLGELWQKNLLGGRPLTERK
ncbi:AAA family ATPase [Nocardiopsis terrae]